jgi:hypothetical protein
MNEGIVIFGRTAAVGKVLLSYFVSGNGVPVERVTIKRDTLLKLLGSEAVLQELIDASVEPYPDPE